MRKYIIGLVIFLFILWNPITRRIFLVILPLGRGIDDILFWTVAIILIGIAIIRGWIDLIGWIYNLTDQIENWRHK